MTINSLVPIDVNENSFNLLINVYEKALDNVYNDLNLVKETINELYGLDIINSITKRIKTTDSIIKKMKEKNYKLNYKNLIEKVNDIAGIRIICPVKDNIYTLIDIIHRIPNIKVINTKDYITKPKKSGYSGYHMIIETPVEINGESIPIKVEIQIRTMAMDFWATNEHKIKYKTNKKLSIIDSKKLVIYAKLLNNIDNKISKIFNKQKLAYNKE